MLRITQDSFRILKAFPSEKDKTSRLLAKRLCNICSDILEIRQAILWYSQIFLLYKTGYRAINAHTTYNEQYFTI